MLKEFEFKMERKDKIIRISLSSYRRIRKEFPAKRDESAADYFDRLAGWLVTKNGSWRKWK